MSAQESVIQRGKIGKQIRLPLRKAVEISFRSLKIRLGRAILATGGVVLALAFLMSVWANSAILDALQQHADDLKPATRVALQKKIGTAEQAQKLANRHAMLVTLSLVVCVTGVVNAMLMSVTERFREIGTMKCLGALDSFIIKLFLIESAFQGAIGAVLGGVIGLLLASVSKLITFGSEVLIYFPVASVLDAVVWTVVIGIGLTVAGAVYPARVAAKMKPVDAMRVEQ
ncbi:MAG TPA: FtsX-like permease family protein [Phycisphaerae bacterium]|nr:FtsX-like permease family protein [Phycisphaerae bacterium]